MRVRISDELVKSCPSCKVRLETGVIYNGIKGSFIAEGEMGLTDIEKSNCFYPEILIQLNSKTTLKVTIGPSRTWAEIVSKEV